MISITFKEVYFCGRINISLDFLETKNIFLYCFIIFKGLLGESANLTKLEFLTHAKMMMHTAAALAVVSWCDESWRTSTVFDMLAVL